ncbi:MAG: glycosyltransferase family 2 protein [Flavobacteriaceae bacterium]|nr:glycosyltransferase family 2 protein [Flavobacteriaceae bacterium]
MHTFFSFFELLEYTFFCYFCFASFYVLFFSISGFFYKDIVLDKSNSNSIVILIPAYKEDDVIEETVRSALQQEYPEFLFDIVVISDSLHSKTLSRLTSLPITVFKVSFSNPTKVKALNYALNELEVSYDIALILDADNIMEKKFLRDISTAFTSGYSIIQAHRKAKNHNTAMAVLDGISEEINNHIFRKGHNAIGLSCGLVGSGMAFNFSYLKTMLREVTAVGGFDKELEFKIIAKRHFIVYLDKTYIYDEKIATLQDFKRQRTRWLATKGVYLLKNITNGYNHLRKGNFAYLNKLIQMALPTRILLLGVSFIAAVCYGVSYFVLDVSSSRELCYYWMALFVISSLCCLIAIPRRYFHWNTIKSLKIIPKVFFSMVVLLFKLRGSNKTFIHTKHKSIKP